MHREAKRGSLPPTMGRFAASPADGGVYVLDTESGEVIFVSHEGQSRVLRAAVTAGPARLLTATEAPIDDIVLATFPAPIAWAWRDYLEETEARQKTRALVDAFTVLLKHWGFATSAAVFASPGLRDISLHRMLARDLQRPLISSWRRLIELSLPLLVHHGDSSVQPWVASFGRVYECVQTSCREPVSMARPYLGEDGELHSNRTRMGWVEALLALRNHLAHRALTSQDIAQEELSIYEPVMRKLLTAAAELTAWQLVEVDPASAERPRGALLVHPWTGRHGRGAAFEVQRPRQLPGLAPEARLLGITTREGALLPLPVFYSRELRDEALRSAQLLSFDGASARGVRYVAGDGTLRDDQRPVGVWNRLVTSISPPPDSATLAALEWDAFVRRNMGTSTLTLTGYEERQIYHAELDTPRVAIDGAFLELLEERRAMLLVGGPGVGKSFAIASFARKRIAAGDAVTFVRATDLEGASPAAQVANALGLPLGTQVEDILVKLTSLPNRTGRWLLMVDGLERASPSAEEWLKAALSWLEASAGGDVMRLVIGMRAATFDTIAPLVGPRNAEFFVRRPRRGNAEPEPGVFVGNFDLDATEEAYERHRKHATACGQGAPTTRYAELAPKSHVREVLRDPVSMRLLVRAYADRPLPSDLPWEEAIGLFLDRTVRDPELPDGGPRWAYLDAFVEWCSRNRRESIDRQQLADLPRLGKAVFDTRTESPYAQLLELGVLVEDWRGATCVVAVSPNRLFEHLLAGHLLCVTAERMLGDIRRLDGLRAAPGAWTIAIHRMVREGNAQTVVDALDACDHGRWRAAQAPLVLAVANVLADLAAHDSDTLERFLETLVQVPSRTDVELLRRTFEAARASGRARVMELVVAALATEAEALDDGELRVDVAIRELEVALEGSDGARMEQLADSLRRLMDAGATEAQAARAAHAEGRAHGQAGRHASAEAAFERAETLAKGAGMLGAASDASRWRSAAATKLQKHVAALGLAEQALRLARECGDKAREGAAYHRMGQVQHILNQRQEALDSYERALVLHLRTGHTAHAAATSLNLGVLLLDEGELERAQHKIEATLRLYESMGNARGVCVALINLAQIARMRGDVYAAMGLAQRAHVLHTSRNAPVEVARGLWLLAELALDLGDLPAALSYREQLSNTELSEASDRHVQLLHCAALDLRRALLRGDELETGIDQLLSRWNAAAEVHVHLSSEERPVSVLRMLGAHPKKPAGLEAALSQLEQRGMIGPW